MKNQQLTEEENKLALKQQKSGQSSPKSLGRAALDF